MRTTTADLFRAGNASGPRLGHVRVGKDISTYSQAGIDWVVARSGGVSTFSRQGNGRNWWLFPAGSAYPDELIVVNDHGNHFSWEPSVDMPLSAYIALLESVGANFHKVS